ncbi:MAG: hypothetical protein BGO43_15325 [Gammaproteobacteria bacterium 39-13]|nr:MAG: hypothetical protein BGO43_15325 [Gammaproteobacteria bacterium 39-13]
MSGSLLDNKMLPVGEYLFSLKPSYALRLSAAKYPTIVGQLIKSSIKGNAFNHFLDKRSKIMDKMTGKFLF